MSEKLTQIKTALVLQEQEFTKQKNEMQDELVQDLDDNKKKLEQKSQLVLQLMD